MRLPLVERVVGFAATGVVMLTAQGGAASADILPTPYCVPGVTASRCRGTFWETGKLYKKGQEGGAYTQTEYTLALQRLDELRGELGSLRTRANRGDDADAVGAQAAAVRVGLRQTGERVARSLAGDERIDTEQRLLATVRILDDVDAVAERQSAADSKAAGPLSSVSLLLDRAVVSFDDFRRALPTSPDPYAT